MRDHRNKMRAVLLSNNAERQAVGSPADDDWDRGCRRVGRINDNRAVDGLRVCWYMVYCAHAAFTPPHRTHGASVRAFRSLRKQEIVMLSHRSYLFVLLNALLLA